ncbi:hypothetical protein VNO77_00521 [Canavalia gladiata]|uniref:Uncharacterized protein n=1 Tax=Canavalia gladiata TaxID=3824 RepID=A0AAN9MQ55_CANGL
MEMVEGAVLFVIYCYRREYLYACLMCQSIVFTHLKIMLSSRNGNSCSYELANLATNLVFPFPNHIKDGLGWDLRIISKLKKEIVQLKKDPTLENPYLYLDRKRNVSNIDKKFERN